MIAKFPAAIEQTRGLARQFRCYEREVNFYKLLAKDISLPSPRCLYASHDLLSDDFLLLLEDLGDVGLEIGCRALGRGRLYGDPSARVISRRMVGIPKLQTIDWVPMGESELNKGGLVLYAFAWPLFLQQFGSDLPDDMRRLGERLSEQIVGMLDRVQDRPRTLCHGDYRLDNFFFGARPEHDALTVVDWQIAVRSIGTYDVGYFVSQSVPPSLRREIELDLLRAYHDRLVELGVRNYSFGDCIDD